MRKPNPKVVPMKTLHMECIKIIPVIVDLGHVHNLTAEAQDTMIVDLDHVHHLTAEAQDPKIADLDLVHHLTTKDQATKYNPIIPRMEENVILLTKNEPRPIPPINEHPAMMSNKLQIQDFIASYYLKKKIYLFDYLTCR